MKSPYRILAPAILLLGCIFGTGCATTIRGSKDVIPVTSSPSGAKVYRDNGEFVGLTPCEVTLWRNKEHRIAVVNDEGNKVSVTVTKPKIDGRAVTGTIFFVGSGFPGLVGLPIDAASGANARLNLRNIFVDFDLIEENFTPVEVAQLAVDTNKLYKPRQVQNVRIVTNPPPAKVAGTNTSSIVYQGQ